MTIPSTEQDRAIIGRPCGLGVGWLGVGGMPAAVDGRQQRRSTVVEAVGMAAVPLPGGGDDVAEVAIAWLPAPVAADALIVGD